MSKPFVLPPHRFGRLWTQQELRRLRELREEGKSFPEIGEIIKRPWESCRTKAVQLGVRSPYGRGGHRKNFTAEALRTLERGRRACMNCKRIFMSDGPHNRLCKSCRRIDVSPFETPVTTLR